MQAERQRNLERQLGDLYGAGMQQAFGQAQQALAQDRAYAQQAAQLGQAAYGNLLSGDAQRLQAAGRLGDYADQRQRMEIERLRNMQAAGEAERRLRQAGMDIGYQDFLRQRAFPQEQLGWQAAARSSWKEMSARMSSCWAGLSMSTPRYPETSWQAAVKSGWATDLSSGERPPSPAVSSTSADKSRKD